MNAQHSSLGIDQMNEDPIVIPEWAFFKATVNGDPYGFDLRDCATAFYTRQKHGMEPVLINPVTMAQWRPRSRNRLVAQLDKLVDTGRLPSELRAGWTMPTQTV